MKIIKSIISIIAFSVTVFYLGCSSAEQTTAKLAYQQGDYAKAEREFEKEVKQNPSNEDAWFYLAMSRAQLGKVDGVREAMAEYRKLGKNSYANEMVNAWGTKYDNGYKLYKDGENLVKEGKDTEAIRKFESAIVEFKLAMAILPDSAFVSENIAALQNRINTISVKPLIDKGVEYEKAGNYEAAINEYMKGIEKVSKGTGAYEVLAYNIAVAYLKLGEKMRDENSENPAYKEKYSAALPYLEELTKTESKDTKLSTYELLVQVYANLGMSDKAMDAMKIRDELREQK
ncbi:MAG: tetratricopeptide repeat protein [Ignavibacteria bacterium]|nr:tetratricopeptide repeat protein [Ignavibacteria bacterium]